MAGYQRQDADGNISNGNIIDATDLNDEFNAVESAFNSTGGHAHDGTAGNGARIEVTGPTGEYVFTSDNVRPAAGETSLDIGASANRFDTGYFNHIDTNGVVFNGGTELTSVDTTITTGSNTAVPTSLAVKNYVDTNITAQDLDITDGTNITAIDLDSESLTFTGSTGISATVSDNTVTFSTTDSEIVHDDLSGFVSNEHVDHSTVSILAGTGLQGGGDLTTSRTLQVDEANINHDNLGGFVANEHVNHANVSILGGTGLSGGGNITASRTLNLSHLGLENLSSPGADRIAFWDQSSGSFQWLQDGSNLIISSTTLNTNPILTNINSISGLSNFTIGYGSGNSLFIQENSSNKVELNKNLLDFKETSGVVNIETQGASLVIGDTSATTPLQLNGVSAIQNYNSTAFQVITVGSHVFTTSADEVTFKSGTSSSQKIKFHLDSGQQRIEVGQQLLIDSQDKVTFKKTGYVGDDDQYRLEIYNDDNPFVDTTEVSLNLQMKTSNGTTVGNYGRLIATPKQTTTAAHDALLKLQAAYNGSLVDVLEFNGGDGKIRLGDGHETVYIDAGNHEVVMDATYTYFGSISSGPRINNAGVLSRSDFYINGDTNTHITSAFTNTEGKVVVSHTDYGSVDRMANLELRNTDIDPSTGSIIGKVSFTQETADNTDMNGPWHEFANITGGSEVLSTSAGRNGFINLNVAVNGTLTPVFKSALVGGLDSSTHVLAPTSYSGSVWVGNQSENEKLQFNFASSGKTLLISKDNQDLEVYAGGYSGTSGSLSLNSKDHLNITSTSGNIRLKGTNIAIRGTSDTVDNFKIEVESDDDVRLETLKNWTDIYLFSQANDGTDRAVFWSGESQAFMPLENDKYDLGSSLYKWDDVYATNSTIQTSDSALKQDVVAISEAETRVAQALKGLLRKYRWITSVEEKGDAARYHFGILAQDVKQAFEDESLNPFDYAMLTKTVEWVTTEDNGKKKSYATQEGAPKGAVETTTWGVRYTELLAFIVAGL